MNTLATQLDALAEASIRIIRENQAPTGGYIASPNFAVYNYSWFRDGAFIAHAMSVANETDSAVRFHMWAAENINRRNTKISELIARHQRGEKIDPEEHLHCRYSVDGLEGEEEWTNFQLDGFGTWLWALDQFKRAGNSLAPEFLEATKNLIPYLIEFWSTPSFDWWEESFGEQHVSTLGCISAGLLSVSAWEEIPAELRKMANECGEEIRRYVLKNGVVNNHLTKWIGSSAVDGSLSALIGPLHWVENSEIEVGTIRAIAEELGELGTHRHRDDVYFGGGPWPLLSAFLALARVSQGDLESAQRTLNWIAGCANNDLELPEQLDSQLLHPEARDGWIEKWGVPAIPLLWSHAMFLLLKEEVDKYQNA